MDFDRNGDIMREGIPNPSPSPPVRQDTRDIRDPQKLGWMLKGLFRSNSTVNLSQTYETFWETLVRVPDYPQDESMGTIAARLYREELESRAAEGDKYAVSALASIDAGKGVEGFDDAGA